MRVVAGEFGGRTLQAPSGLATRPTTDKVRQAVFNSLQAADLVHGVTVVDLFAGSGALGIEALSRGAAMCTFVERERAALDALRANVATLRLHDRTRIVGGDAMAFVAAGVSADLVLADPPYEFDGWPALLATIHAPVMVCEASQPLEADGWQAGADGEWEVARSRRYGRTWVTTLHRVAFTPT